jgi:TrpR-related protein YerC/YecD
MKKTDQPKNTAQNVEALSEALNAVKSASEAKQFLLDLCTPAELEAMSDRWVVVAPLLQETPYRTIHEQTGVSVTTIGRVARCLNDGSTGYLPIANRLKQGR